MKGEVVLNPDYYFIRDEDRVSLRSGRYVNKISNSSWLSFIHPFQAYILSLFAEGEKISNVSALVSEKYNVDKSAIEEILASYVNNETPIYTIFKSQNIQFPKNVLVDCSRISSDKKNSYSHKRSVRLNEYLDREVDLETDRIKTAPRSLLYMITQKCRTKCNYCYADILRKNTGLSIEQIRHFILDAKNAGVEYIDIIGGEIFCHEKWDEILSLLVELDMCPSYISTKIPLTEDEVVRLKHTGFNGQFQISLDSTDSDKLSKIICAPLDYFNRMKNFIYHLTRYDFNPQINTVLTSVNTSLADMDSLYEFISTIDQVAYWEIRVPEVSIYNLTSYLKTRPSRKVLIECLEYVRKTIVPKSKFEILVSDSALHTNLRCYDENCTTFPGGSCGALKENMFILPDGKVSICEQLYWLNDFIIGDVKYQSIQEIWSSEKATNLYDNVISLYKKSEICSRCSSLQWCAKNKRKCWVKILKAYNTMSINHPDPRCIYAPRLDKDYLTYSNK
jgi:involved moaA/nifB/pqqE family protein